MHTLRSGISPQALNISWGDRERAGGCDEKAASCLFKYISNAQRCSQSHGFLLLFLISMLGFHVGSRAEGTGWVLGSKGLPPRSHTRVWEAPRCPALLLADGGGCSQLPPGSSTGCLTREAKAIICNLPRKSMIRKTSQ